MRSACIVVPQSDRPRMSSREKFVTVLSGNLLDFFDDPSCLYVNIADSHLGFCRVAKEPTAGLEGERRHSVSDDCSESVLSGFTGRSLRSDDSIRKPLQVRDDSVPLRGSPWSILLNHEDEDAPFLDINLHCVIVGSAMAKAVRRDEPAKSIARFAQTAILSGGHFMERGLGKISLSVERPSIQNHPAENRYIRRRRK
jgi:hypothetical protein